jgi:cobalt-zinc-cadmium efflux system membrane fusion protein
MKLERKWLLVALTALALLALGIWFAVSRPIQKDSSLIAETATAPAILVAPNTLRYSAGAPQLTMIRSKALQLLPVPLTDPLNARVAYDEDVTARIGVSISGRIVEVKASPGNVVKSGQVLAEIDSPDFGTASSDLSKAKADEARKRLVVERGKELVPGEAISAKEFEAAQADYAQAQAETLRAEQRLKNLNPHGLVVRGQRIALASPMNGVVTERNATPALEVSPALTAPLFVVTDPKRLSAIIDLPEKLLGRIKLGGAVAIASDAFPDETFPARIVQLGQIVDPNTRRVAVRARVDNSSGKLLPEMFVRASLLQASGTGVQVPNSAIVNRGIYAYVFVRTESGDFQRRQVKLLTQGSDFSYLGEGVRGGEQVVLTGALLLDAELTALAGSKP